MTVITIDQSTGEKLRGVSEPVQLRDERGILLGEFRPAQDPPFDPGVESPRDDDVRSFALRRLVERMSRASVSAEAFPITREALHERR